MVVALDLTPADIVTRVTFHPVPLAVLLAMVIGYRRGVGALAARGRHWPPLRSAAFVVAVVILAAATLSGLTSYDTTSFAVAATQQVGLLMLAPVALCRAAPLTLFVEASAGAGGARLRSWAEGRPGKVLYNPALSWAVFAGGLFALYLSHQYAWAVSHTGGLGLVDLELFVLGCWFVWPVMGVDPRPRKLAAGWRVVYVLLCVVYYSVLGLAMESQRNPLTARISASSFHTGAGTIWSVGVLLSIGMTIGVIFEWLYIDEGHARRADTVNAEDDAMQLALWRADRRAAALADVRARDSVVVHSRPAGTERSDRTATSARSWSGTSPGDADPNDAGPGGPAPATPVDADARQLGGGDHAPSSTAS